MFSKLKQRHYRKRRRSAVGNLLVRCATLQYLEALRWKASERNYALKGVDRIYPQKDKISPIPDSRFPIPDSRFPIPDSNPLRLHSRRDYQDMPAHYHNAYNAWHPNHDQNDCSWGISQALCEHSSHCSVLR